eukprot:scaffold8459_cov90-Skeletonema_marinoi.AAC.1
MDKTATMPWRCPSLPSKGSKRRNLSDTSMEMEEESIQDEQQQQRHITILKGDCRGRRNVHPHNSRQRN